MHNKKKFIPKKETKKKETILKVTEEAELLNFLIEKFPEKSRTNVKSLLTNKQIEINGEVETQYNRKLNIGEQVAVVWAKIRDKDQPDGMKIIYEDNYIIGIEKEAGLLSIATEKQTEDTAFSILSEYVKKQGPKNLIFIVHRLDRDTSGVMIFAKNQEVQKALRDNWQDVVKARKYVAVVEGDVEKDEGTITSWLKENKAMIMYSSNKPEDGQKAVTHYKVLQRSRYYSLVELDLETGRKNQIRVHMMDMGHSVIGDDKYKSLKNPIYRLGLHARLLTFTHPITGKDITLETKIPDIFMGLF